MESARQRQRKRREGRHVRGSEREVKKKKKKKKKFSNGGFFWSIFFKG